MKVLLVRPNLAPRRSSDALTPLAFALLTGQTPPGVELVVQDERLAPLTPVTDADLVAISVETYTARRAYQLADRYRASGIPVVLGGPHPTVVPEEAAGHADAVVRGDAEKLWPQLLAQAEAGNLQPLYEAPPGGTMDGLQYDRRVFDGLRYGPIDLVQYGRGCGHVCEFCSIHAWYGKTKARRPVAEVVAELALLPRRHLFFVDDNLALDPRWLAELCDGLIPLRRRWSCQLSLDALEAPELGATLASAGCSVVILGFESLRPENLCQMGKAWNRSGRSYTELVAELAGHGIMVYGTFVFGYDHDRPDCFEATVDFAVSSGLFLANFNPLTPMPGTALYRRLEAEQRLLSPTWWLEPGYRYGQAVFRPVGLSPDQLTEGCFRARRRFNSLSTMARRAFANRANYSSVRQFGLFALANLVSRREILHKQGLGLGEAEETSCA
ncbi:MAG: hypothetical protein A2284_15505 [Deltaproteobacteria bacterium RIFOXYA12_FULL_61_11]|nr:MAG: hypothetical protein A2284_15505 [Deltaproteobacteria bacterium RIFOXYA12_FULL_61_11]